MSSPPPRHNGRSDLRPGRIALGYALIGLLWIYGSGYVVAALTSGSTAAIVESVKGTGFVVFTAAGLYILLARRAYSIRSAESARAAADEERRRLAAAVEQAAEAIVITDPEARILYVNPALERLSGYAKSELLGRKPRLLNDDSQRGTNALMWPKLSGSDTWRGALLNVRKDGVVYEVDTIISPIRDAAGKIVSYVAVQHDVSQERAVERQLAEARRMEAVGQLAGGIAHDFNNLLTAISGYAELLGEEVKDNPGARADVDEIRRASRSAANLVRQLLALGRRQVLAPAGLALDELVEQLRPMLDGLLGPRVNLHVHRSEGLRPVFADSGQIEQVLVNLAVNARDAMPAGGSFTISLSNVTLGADDERADVVKPGDYVVMAAADTGTGMDEATLARAFEPFFTTKPSGEGTGLGLATTYGIVKQSGGHLFADTEVGRGSTFTVYLPQYDGPVVAAAAEQTPEPPLGGTETILVVEDDDAVRVLVSQSLERLGYRVIVSSDAGQALTASAAETGPVPLLVTDIRLPGPDGPSLAAQLKERHPGLRVLYVSGYAGEAMIKSGILGPNEAFLAKPFSADDLGRRVRALLDGGDGV